MNNTTKQPNLPDDVVSPSTGVKFCGMVISQNMNDRVDAVSADRKANRPVQAWGCVFIKRK